MNGKIDFKENVEVKNSSAAGKIFSIGFIIVTTITAAIILLLLIYGEKILLMLDLFPVLRNPFYLLFLPPSIVVTGKTIIDGIAMFNGNIPKDNLGHDIWMFWSILISFFISPFLLFTGIKSYYKKQFDGLNKYVVDTHHAVLCIGGILVLVFIFNGAVSYYSSIYQMKGMKETNNKQTQRDELISEITDLSFGSLEYLILKSDLANTPVNKLTIPQLNELTAGKKLIGEFIIKPVLNKDTVMIITCTGRVKGTNPDFQNANINKGMAGFSSVIMADASFDLRYSN